MASEAEITTLFSARGDDFSAVCKAADDLRRLRNGDTVTYVVVRNINYTNICTYGCKFCAFSKRGGSPPTIATSLTTSTLRK